MSDGAPVRGDAGAGVAEPDDSGDNVAEALVCNSRRSSSRRSCNTGHRPLL